MLPFKVWRLLGRPIDWLWFTPKRHFGWLINVIKDNYDHGMVCEMAPINVDVLYIRHYLRAEVQVVFDSAALTGALLWPIPLKVSYLLRFQPSLLFPDVRLRKAGPVLVPIT